MSQTPSRPYDERLTNVGTWTGPCYDTSCAGDAALAGTTYVKDCAGRKDTNGPVPQSSMSVGNFPNNVEVKPDGTVYRYFIYGRETQIDSYCNNNGITPAQYNARSASVKARYCDKTKGGLHYLKSPSCGFVRTVSRPIGADVWYPVQEPPPQPDCPATGVSQGEITVTGTTGGSVFGSGPYTLNSDIDTAAVHAGLITPGTTAVIVKKSASPDRISNFPGSTRNGVTSLASSNTFTGVIDELEIVEPGPLGSTSIDVTPLNVSGSGADIAVTTNSSGLINDTIIYGGGSEYQVGDTFLVEALSFGSGTTGKLRVSKVKTQTGGAGCGINIDLVRIISGPDDNGNSCDAESNKTTMQITVENGDTRGSVSTVQLITPYPPSEYLASYPTGGLNSGALNTSASEQQNWYKSCPLVDYQSYDNQTGAICDNISGIPYVWTQVSGPSNGEPNQNMFTLGHNIKYYNNVTDKTGCLGGSDCNPNSVAEPGRRHINWYVYDIPGPGIGKGSPLQGGSGFAIDDVFELRPASSSVPLYSDNKFAKIKVTSLYDTFSTSQSTLDYVVESDVGLAYSIESGLENIIISMVRSVDTTSTGDQVLREAATVTIALFEDLLGRGPQPVEFQQYTRAVYLNGGALSADVRADFNQEYSAYLDYSPEIISCGSQYGGEEFVEENPDGTGDGNDFNPGGIGTGISGGDTIDQDISNLDCRFDKNDFYRGTNGSSNGQIDLNELWNFFGRPKNNTQSVCPRPNSGLAQDNEPDISDFAGLRLQRWIPCPANNETVVRCVNETISDDIATYEKASRITWRNGQTKIGNLFKSSSNSVANAINSEYLKLFDRPAEQSGLNYWYNDVATYGLQKTLSNIAYAGRSESSRGGVLRIEKYCDYTASVSRFERNTIPLADRGTVEEVVVPCQGDNCTNQVVTTDIATYNFQGLITWNDGFQRVDTWVKNTSDSIANQINNVFLTKLGRPAAQSGMEFWWQSANGPRGLEQTLLDLAFDIDNNATEELTRGFPKSNNTASTPVELYCSWANVGSSINLGFFINTRVAPWWGTQYLDAPSLSTSKASDTIYMVNVPVSQSDVYTLKAQPRVDANNKTFFEVTGDIVWPSIQGKSISGEPAIVPRAISTVTWFKYDASNQTYEPQASSKVSNSGSLVTGASGQFRTTFTPAGTSTITDTAANSLDFNQTGDYYVCKILIDNTPNNPKSPGATVPNFGGVVSNDASYKNPARRSKLLLNTVLCNDIDITCGGSSIINAQINDPVTITFGMTLTSPCLSYQSGTAKVSIRRVWTGTHTTAQAGQANKWIIEKQSVTIPITNSGVSQIRYDLTVPTDKENYLNDDGNWKYYAYWDIDFTGIECLADAWNMTGPEFCNPNLSEIYCQQQQTCVGGSASDFTFGGVLNKCDRCCGPVFDDSFDCRVFRNEGGCESKCNNLTSENISPYGLGCECPQCEQNVEVKIEDSTKCGVMGVPNQYEDGGPGPNNAKIRIAGIGNAYIDQPSQVPISISQNDLNNGNLQFESEAWVYLRLQQNEEGTVTLGNDAAIDILSDGTVSCEETVFTQIQWYVQYFYKNGTQSVRQNLAVTGGGSQSDSYLAKYNPSAGTNTEAMTYAGEVGSKGNISKKSVSGSFTLGYDIATVNSVKVFAQISSTNDYFGASRYHPPPNGYQDSDFGTDNTITSTLVGSKSVFEIAHFTVENNVEVPSFPASIGTNCPPAQVEFTETGQVLVEASSPNTLGIFTINWGNIPVNQRKSLEILWYVNGTMVKKGTLKVSGSGSSLNVRPYLEDPDTTYVIKYFIVASPESKASWKTINYNDSTYDDTGSWQITTSSNNNKLPVEQSDRIPVGNRWQTIMASGSCSVTTSKAGEALVIPKPAGSIFIDPKTEPRKQIGSTPPYFMVGQLNVVLTNEGDYPTPPGKQQLTGTTSYQWYTDGQAISGATGPSLSGIPLRGEEYYCLVKYTASVPSGVDVVKNPTEKAIIVVTPVEELELCSDGTFAPKWDNRVNCPVDPIDPCPTKSDLTVVTNETAFSPRGTQTLDNGEDLFAQIAVRILTPDAFKNGLKLRSGSATVWANQSDLRKVILTGFVTNAKSTFKSESFKLPKDNVKSNVSKSYQATYTLIFECIQGGDDIIISGSITGLTVNWVGSQGGDTIEAPSCQYAGTFSSATGCGSYVSGVRDVNNNFRWEAVTKRNSVDPADWDPRGPVTANNPITNCSLCPAPACPSVNITGFTISPQNPKTGDSVTVQAKYTINKITDKFNYQNNSSAFKIGGAGVTGQPSNSTGRFVIGPYTSGGLKDITISYSNIFTGTSQYPACDNLPQAPDRGLLLDSKTFQFNVEQGLVPDPTVNPSVSATLTGPTTLSIPLCGSAVTGTFKINSSLSNNGWVPSDTSIRYNYEGKTNQESNTFSRTFTQEGTYTLTASASKFWCSPAIDKPCTYSNTGGSYPYGRKFASDTDSITVKVVKQPKSGTPPSVTGNDFLCFPETCVDDGSNPLGIRVTVSAQVNNGTGDYAATSFTANGPKWNLNASNTRTTKNTFFMKGGTSQTAQASVTFGQNCGPAITAVSNTVTITVTNKQTQTPGGPNQPGPGPNNPFN